jgi:FkbM family methyltransferase
MVDDFQLIELLYQSLLGRAADPAGLAANVSDLKAYGNIRRTIDSIVSSPEYALRQRRVAGLTDSLAPLLGRPLSIVDIGAQKLASEDHAYQPLLDLGVACICHSFEPIEARRLELDRQNEHVELKLYDCFIGDGNPHDFYVNSDDATSSVYPLNLKFNQHFNHLETLRTVRSVPVETRRLDDVLAETGWVDFLKLDIQGHELSALQGATALLKRTNTIQCEVEFGPIYSGQPLFSDVELFLRQSGFEFIDFHKFGRYHCTATPQVTGNPERLLWADAVFVRTLPPEPDPEDALAQAVVLQTLYGKHGLAQRVLMDAGWSVADVANLFAPADPARAAPSLAP